jgi:hypothetical protein
MDIQRFSKALPHVNAWIAATLDTHRKRARFVGSMGFSKLPMYYPVQLLASVRVVEVTEIPVPPLTALGLPEFADFEGITASGITYLDTVFVLSGQVWNESLYFHELVHAAQWQYLGPEKFLMAYAVGLYQDGYYANPVETMAYELQAAFDRGHPPFDVAAEVARRLDSIVPSMLERAA